MPVTVEHEQFSLWKGTFSMPGRVMGQDNPLEGPGAALVKALARAGWEVPGFDVTVSASSGHDGAVKRRVSGVAFYTPHGRLKLGFHNGHGDGYGLSSATWDGDGDRETAFYDDGSGRGRDKESVTRILAAIAAASEALARIDPFPGHDDVTEEGDRTMRKLCSVAAVPIPDGFPALYSWADREAIHRMGGHATEDGSVPYGLSGSGWRLLALGTCADGGIDPRTYDGFTYASADPSSRAGHPGHAPAEDFLPVEMNLRCLNDVFVFDAEAYRNARASSHSEAIEEGRDRFTEAEVAQWSVAAARTFVPFEEYDGSYADPVVLVGRRLFADECRIMRGHVSVREAGEGAEAVISDGETGLDMVLSTTRSLHPGQLRNLIRVARDAAEATGCKVKVSQAVREQVERHREPALEF